MVVIFIGWYKGLENAEGMMRDVCYVIIGNSAQYATKSTVEHCHGGFSNPIVNAVSNSVTQAVLQGVNSGDLAAGVIGIAQAAQAETDLVNANINPILPSDTQDNTRSN